MGGKFRLFSDKFFSEERSLDEVYDIIEPVLAPELAKVEDAKNPSIWNPNDKEVLVSLNHNKMAQFGIIPRQVFRAIEGKRYSYTGSPITIGSKDLPVKVKGFINDIDDLKKVIVNKQNKQQVYLSEIAKISFGPKTDVVRSFKTNGSPSLILFSSPKGDGNIKKMSEDIIKIVEQKKSLFPKDIQYRVLVDPSEFIRASINNVFKEVFIAAFLAVLILFAFIGSFRNVITAAIEIPLSMVLAFFMMKISGMNLNLISLGGLALASGMNVDASVVVLENIFRHQEIWLKKFGRKPNMVEASHIIVTAVGEVAIPVIVSMITTLVVFIPLVFTTDLTSAILGDLAKAVIFSHGFSAFIAIVLVPTIRMMMINRFGLIRNKPLVDPVLNPFEKKYLNSLENILASRTKKLFVLLTPIIVLIILSIGVLPNLPKKIIGKPDSDWMIVGVSSSLSKSGKQMESIVAETENKALQEFGGYIKYTFTQVHNKRSGNVMLRMHNKKQMEEFWKKLEKTFENSPLVHYWVAPWNPAQMPIPNPADFLLEIRGKNYDEVKVSADKAQYFIKETQLFSRTQVNINTSMVDSITFEPYKTIWRNLERNGIDFRRMIF